MQIAVSYTHLIRALKSQLKNKNNGIRMKRASQDKMVIEGNRTGFNYLGCKIPYGFEQNQFVWSYLWCSKPILKTRNTKGPRTKIYKTITVPTSRESWVLTQRQENHIQAVEMKLFRAVKGCRSCLLYTSVVNIIILC